MDRASAGALGARDLETPWCISNAMKPWKEWERHNVWSFYDSSAGEIRGLFGDFDH